jgi:hypothetical protein
VDGTDTVVIPLSAEKKTPGYSPFERTINAIMASGYKE